jgi:hypothetical protein
VKASTEGTKGLVTSSYIYCIAQPKPQLLGHESYKKYSADRLKGRVPMLSTWMGEIRVITEH